MGRDAISELRDGFADHRRSTFEQARGEPDAALEYAEAANRKILHPPFEVMANLANCEIEAGRSVQAISTLTRIQQRFGGTNHDAQVGLRCKYELRFGSLQAAEGLWNSLRMRYTPVHNGLRLSILNRKAGESGLGDLEEAEHKELTLRQSLADLTRSERMLGSDLSRSE